MTTTEPAKAPAKQPVNNPNILRVVPGEGERRFNPTHDGATWPQVFDRWPAVAVRAAAAPPRPGHPYSQNAAASARRLRRNESCPASPVDVSRGRDEDARVVARGLEVKMRHELFRHRLDIPVEQIQDPEARSQDQDTLPSP